MQTTHSLRELVNNVVKEMLPIAVNRGSFFINDINPDINVNASNDMLTDVFSNMLRKAVLHTENDCIKISAQKISDIIFLRVKETIQCSCPEMISSMQEIQPSAEKMRAYISIRDRKLNRVDMDLVFYNGNKGRAKAA